MPSGAFLEGILFNAPGTAKPNEFSPAELVVYGRELGNHGSPGVSRPVEWNEQSTGKPAIDDPEPSEIPDPAIEFPLEIVPETPGVCRIGLDPDGSEDEAARLARVGRDGAGRREGGTRWRGATREWSVGCSWNAWFTRAQARAYAACGGWGRKRPWSCAAASCLLRGGFKTLYDGLPRPSILEILGKRRPWKAIVRQNIGFEMRSSP